MNWVDLVIIFILLFFTFEGFKKPLFSEFFSLFGFIFSFLISLQFYNFVAKQLELMFTLPHSLTNVLGFIIVWYIAEITIFVLTKFIYRSIKFINLSGGSIFSMIPAAFKGLVLIAIILEMVVVLPLQPQVKKDIRASKISSWVLANTYQIEAPLKNVFGSFANDSLSFLTVEPKTQESVKLGFKNDKFIFDEALEFKMIQLVNQERISQGVLPLTFDPALRQIGRDHSADMFLKGYFSHYSPDGKNVANRATDAGIDYQVIGENLAFAPSLELAHKGLMNSPGHRTNILSQDFHRIGIGIANGDENGLMITQVFEN